LQKWPTTAGNKGSRGKKTKSEWKAGNRKQSGYPVVIVGGFGRGSCRAGLERALRGPRRTYANIHFIQYLDKEEVENGLSMLGGETVVCPKEHGKVPN